jgi:hypothetical protein
VTNPNIDIQNLLKKEMEDTLFESLDFHSGLKDLVKNKIKSSKRKSALTYLWKSPSIRVVIFAAILVLAYSSILTIHRSDSTPIKNEKRSTFEKRKGNPNLISDPNTIKSWSIDSATDVKQWFGNEVLVPTYSVKEFKLDKIQAKGISKEEVNQIVFTYFSNSNSYLVIIKKDSFENKPFGFEKVDLNGVTGYLKTEETNVELQWNEKGFQYMVGGLITGEEAIKIAKSFK